MADKTAHIFADGAEILAKKIIERCSQDQVSVSLAGANSEEALISPEGYALIAEVLGFLANSDTEL